MKLFATLFALASAATVFAQSSTANPFNVPDSGYKSNAGDALNLTWTPTTSGTISLYLRSGNSAFLNTSGTIATGLANNGQYTWNIPTNIVRGSSYAIEIVSDSDTSLVNYTPQFIINSDVLTASGSSLIATATSAAASGSTTASTAASTTGSSSVTATSSGASTTSSASKSTAASAGIQTIASSTGAAARATAMAGMLGVVALGALAL